MSLRNFRVFNLSCSFYDQCSQLRLPRHLKDQLSRASSSISLNIAEGLGKSTHKDQRKFFSIAYGSAKESAAILILEKVNNPDLHNLNDHINACLYKLIKKPSS